MVEAIASHGQTIYTLPESQSDIVLELSEPQSRVRVRLSSGIAGRAEARFEGRSWAAKHYWREGEAGAEVTVYEFDEPLPTGRVVLRVPVNGVEAAPLLQ